MLPYMGIFRSYTYTYTYIHIFNYNKKIRKSNNIGIFFDEAFEP